jgi:trehalose/maltose transport system substrate-binding protein
VVDLRDIIHDPISTVAQNYLKAPFETNVEASSGKVMGLPVFTDFGLLYFRQDLCHKYNLTCPPQTWDELENVARIIQTGERQGGNLNFHGFIWTGRSYESFHCTLLEWYTKRECMCVILV